MSSAVPPKPIKLFTLVTAAAIIGTMAIIARDVAPKNVNRVTIDSKYTSVGRPGRTPTINPPYFFIFRASSDGLKEIAV